MKYLSFVCAAVLCSLFFFANSQAKDFQRIAIPGAQCGLGDQYYVYVRSNDPNKLHLSFQGGGACQSYEAKPDPQSWQEYKYRMQKRSQAQYGEREAGNRRFANRSVAKLLFRVSERRTFLEGDGIHISIID